VTPAPFEITSAEVGGVRVIAVQGELDLSTAPALEEPLESALSNGAAALMIDLSRCEFIDSTGIAMIVRTWQRLENGDGAEGGHLAICSQNEQVLRVLEISGLNLSIPIHGTADEGLAALEDGAPRRPA
jgi:anti-sigma B factor antagonist